MKRSLLVFVVAALVALSTVFWLMQSSGSLNSTDALQFATIGLLVMFALYMGFRRLGSEKRGEPAEDELSKHVLQKAAAWAYFISLYLWVALLVIKDRVSMDTEQLLGTGILGMGVAFAGCWLIVNFRGLRNE